MKPFENLRIDNAKRGAVQLGQEARRAAGYGKAGQVPACHGRRGEAWQAWPGAVGRG